MIISVFSTSVNVIAMVAAVNQNNAAVATIFDGYETSPQGVKKQCSSALCGASVQSRHTISLTTFVFFRARRLNHDHGSGTLG